jgi:hypothetical protein
VVILPVIMDLNLQVDNSYSTRLDCWAQLNKPFAISAVPKAFIPHIWRLNGCECSGPFAPQRAAKGKRMNMENDMTSKITAILAAAVVLASAGVASAQTHRHAGAQWQAPYANSDTRNLRFGHANDPQFDPYAGTVFEGVAPY